MVGGRRVAWRPESADGPSRYTGREDDVHVLMKVETHNHPTAISPFPGAATGAGGEIRDEGATGRGSEPKAGLTGFAVSNLHLPGLDEPWEAEPYGAPHHIASPLEIMVEGPIGAAAFNNEFGRPGLGGFFRVYEQTVDGVRRGYHKPIMSAGGLGTISAGMTEKVLFPAGTLLVQIGGGGMRIGMGGGAASSMAAGANAAELDFDSVQRGNPEIERRAQEVVNHCWRLGEDNPIRAIDMPMEVLLGKPPRMTRDVARVERDAGDVDLSGIDVRNAAYAVLRHPTVASKRFLVTIADRTVGGLTHRDQMVGPWQVPVADVAVTLGDHVGFAGEAMATGERMPLAAVDGPASGRMAVGEALTNLLAAPVTGLRGVKLSCNWMAACGEEGEDAALYDTVEAVAMELCPALGVSVPVGKDSLSMRTRWTDATTGRARQVTSPVSLVVTAFASLPDVRGTLTPELRGGRGDAAGGAAPGETVLVLVDLGAGRDRLGGSVVAQVAGVFGGPVPDLDDPQRLLDLVAAVNDLRSRAAVLAYHDRSDGGLWATVAEMAFAGACGVEVHVPSLAGLFAEELGAVVEGPAARLAEG